MHLSTAKFTAYERYLEMGGVLNIQIYDECEDTIENHRRALATLLELSSPKPLTGLTPKRIKQAAFHGDFFDTSVSRLIPSGRLTDYDGSKIAKPYLTDLKWPRACAIPHPEWDGNFAYAYLHPPYGLNNIDDKSPGTLIENTYLEICHSMMPTKNNHILSWWQSELIDIAPQLEIGTEYWGVFVFTIHNADQNTISAIAGATSD